MIYFLLYPLVFTVLRVLIRVLARVQFTAFMAHRCDTAVLRRAVSRQLTVKQLHEVLRFFGFMGDVGPELANAPQH